MFGFSKDCTIKKEMILDLDNQEESVPSQVLTQNIGSVTNQTIRKYLQEIKSNIDNLYTPEELRIEINRRSGIRLFRQNANFDRLFAAIYEENIIYEIFRYLLNERTFESKMFCEKFQISLSNLRRKIQDINDAIAIYDLYLTVGKKVTLYGNESSIRLLFFSFYYVIHHGIRTISFVDSQENLQQAEKICHYLAIEPSQTRIDLLALWLFINQKSIENQKPLALGVVTNQFKTQITCPNFLENFEEPDWHFYLAILEALEFISLKENDNFQAEHENKFSEATRHWIASYEEHVAELTIAQKEQVTKMMYHLSLLDEVLVLEGDVYTSFEVINEEKWRTSYPNFASRFAKFWSDFSKAAPEESRDFVKAKSLLLCFDLIPEELLYQKVSLCLLSNASLNKQTQIKRHLKNQLQNKAALTFVERPKAADLVIQTEDITGKKVKDSNQVILSTVLSRQDILTVAKALEVVRER